MKKLLLAGAALVVLTSAASAADLAARPYTKAPAYVAPVYNWTGFYAGVMGGYGWSNQVDIAGATASTGDLNGGFGGGQIGYNWQFGGPWVFGIEAEAAGSGIKYNETVVGLGSFEDKIRSFGSVTGRLGWASGPTLLYAKGGWAWADNRVAITSGGTTISDSQFHSGWTIGAGVEYMFAPAWSAKAEYMYADYGDKTYFGLADVGASVHSVKAGINYHFNWGGPVVARY
jgi:outer membrane immunogenic protein